MSTKNLKLKNRNRFHKSMTVIYQNYIKDSLDLKEIKFQKKYNSINNRKRKKTSNHIWIVTYEIVKKKYNLYF